MTKGKVCVVGGGPAGLFAAIEAAKRGFSVTLYEMGEIGENIKCAEGFLDSLNILGEPEAGVRFKVREMVVRGKETYTIDMSPINLWMIDRKEWQKYLGEKAQRMGVEISENHPISPDDLERIKKEFRWIIDASGVFSVTSKLYGFKHFYTANSGVTVQYVMEGDFSYLKERILAGIEPHYTGYYWIFPKGPQIANVGMGVLRYKKGMVLRNELERIVEKEGLKSYRILRSFGGLCPIAIPGRIVYDNILLAGDACGLTSPLHCGGIDLACISGMTAAAVIAEDRVSGYKDELWKVIGDKITLERELFEFWDSRGYDTVDALIRRFSRKKKFPYFLMNPTKYSRQLILLLKALKLSRA